MTAAISIAGLSVVYHGHFALRDVSLEVEQGESFGLVGESGSGKSTLLRAIAGLAPVSAGSITVNGKRLGARRDKAFYREVQMVFQDPYGSLHPRQTVDRLLLEPLVIHGFTDAETRIVRALDEKGEQIEAEGTELLARCMQHEIDHLDGKLFIDYLSMLKRRSALSKWEKIKDDYPNFIRKVAQEIRGPHHSEGEL